MDQVVTDHGRCRQAALHHLEIGRQLAGAHVLLVLGAKGLEPHLINRFSAHRDYTTRYRHVVGDRTDRSGLVTGREPMCDSLGRLTKEVRSRGFVCIRVPLTVEVIRRPDMNS